MKVVYAVADAAIPLPGAFGATKMVYRGSHWSADDPLVQAHPDLFSSDPTIGLSFSGSEPPAETATAVPGERRNVRRG